jgi:hypothetical protein
VGRHLHEQENVVIGSQAILGAVDEPPESMLLSMEVDIYPSNEGSASRPASWRFVSSPAISFWQSMCARWSMA